MSSKHFLNLPEPQIEQTWLKKLSNDFWTEIFKLPIVGSQVRKENETTTTTSAFAQQWWLNCLSVFRLGYTSFSMLSKLNGLKIRIFEKTVAKQKYWVLWNAFVFKILRLKKFDHVLPFLRIDLKKEYILKSVFAGVENCWIGIVQTQNWNHYWLKARIKK